jgi:hypothetical protein
VDLPGRRAVVLLPGEEETGSDPSR